jgi:hypothetical protein
MACTPSEVYRLSAEKLRQVCSEEGLDADGPVQSLHQRHVQLPEVVATVDELGDLYAIGKCYDVCGGSNSVLSVLLRRVPSL